MERARGSLNSITLAGASASEVIAAAEASGFSGVGLWRNTYAEAGVASTARQIEQAGLRVSSVCRGGLFPYRDRESRAAISDDNHRAVDEAAALNAECLVLVCGAPTSRDLGRAREQIYEGVSELAAAAADASVRLAIEPMHPMMISTRSAITSIGDAQDLVERVGAPHVGLAIDAYHVWWDVALQEQLNRAKNSIFSVQVSDWITPVNDELLSRGMPGEGSIDLASFIRTTDAAGYDDLVEIEVLSSYWQRQSLSETLDAILASWDQL